MTMPEAPSPDVAFTQTALKASEVATTLIQEIRENAPLLLSLLVTSFVLLIFTWGLGIRWRLAFLALTVFFLSYSILQFVFRYRPVRAAIHQLKRLGRDEKELLQQLFLEDRRTAHINIFNAASASLIAKGILTWTSSIIVPLQAGVVIQPYVMDFLKKHPEYIELTRADFGREEYQDNSPWHRRPDLDPPPLAPAAPSFSSSSSPISP